MKKTFCAVIALSAAAMGFARLPQVASISQVDLPGNVAIGMAAISPDGSYAVVSPLSGQGLQHLDLNNGRMTAISATASPLMLEFTADGSNVLYRESSYDSDHRRYVSLKAYNVANRQSTTVVEASRNLQGFNADGNTAVAIENGRMQRHALGGNTAEAATRAALSIDRGRLCVTTGGSTTTIAPLGNSCNSYLWPSLSPDGTRIVAFGVGTGTFTCNLDGSDVHPLGMFRAPRWLDNNTIVAMDDHDNGYQTTASTIMALAADGSGQAALTTDDVVAIFPTTAAGKVAFTTPEGQLFIITLK